MRNFIKNLTGCNSHFRSAANFPPTPPHRRHSQQSHQRVHASIDPYWHASEHGHGRATIAPCTRHHCTRQPTTCTMHHAHALIPWWHLLPHVSEPIPDAMKGTCARVADFFLQCKHIRTHPRTLARILIGTVFDLARFVHGGYYCSAQTVPIYDCVYSRSTSIYDVLDGTHYHCIEEAAFVPYAQNGVFGSVCAIA